MSNRVGIITFYYNNHNYGGLLQAYALQQAVENLGYDCLQIAYNKTEAKWRRWRRRLTQNPIHYVHKLIQKLDSIRYEYTVTNSNTSYQTELQERRMYFDSFINQIKHTQKVYTEATISQCVKEFDIIITGSDQVWNLAFGGKDFFLAFVPDDIKKISYAASTGKHKWSEKECKVLVPLLNRMDFISVREYETQTFLNTLINKKVAKVVDPTLLISEDKWNDIAADRIIEEPYLFAYLLGANIQHREAIHEYAKKLQLKIVTLPCIDPYNQELLKADSNFGDIRLYRIGPKEFISLIKHADYIFTDSFHGTVFSLIYHKCFYAFCRYRDSEDNSMNTRMYSLLDSVALRTRLLSDTKKLSKNELTEKINYGEVDNKLMRYRKESYDFLREALENSLC